MGFNGRKYSTRVKFGFIKYFLDNFMCILIKGSVNLGAS